MTPSEYFLKIDESVNIYTYDKTLYWRANALKDIIEHSDAIIENKYHEELGDIVFKILIGLLKRLNIQVECIKILSEQREQYDFLKNLLKKFDKYKNKSDPAIEDELKDNKELQQILSLTGLPIKNLQKYPFKRIMDLVKTMKRSSKLFKEEVH